MTPPMNDTAQSKKIFYEEAQSHTNFLIDRIAKLDVKAIGYNNELDSILSANKDLQNLAIKAYFYVPNSPFVEVTHHFEKVINQLSDQQLKSDEILKRLLVEEIDLMRQIVNEYCLEPEINSDWLKYQSNLLDKFDKHLVFNTHKPEITESSFKDNEPFYLEDTTESLHLFDIDSDDLPMLFTEDLLDDSDSYLLIQTDNAELSEGSLLAMPELLADIFSAPPEVQFVGNEDETELQGVNWDEDEEEMATIAEDFSDAWVKFSSLDAWTGMDDVEVSRLENLQIGFDNSLDDDVSAVEILDNYFGFLEEDGDKESGEKDEEEDENTFWDSLGSIKDIQSAEFTLEQSSNSYLSSIDSDILLLEIPKDSDFESSDVDTAIEVSPIYQNDTSDFQPSWNNLAQSISVQEKVVEIELDNKSLSVKDLTSLDTETVNNRSGLRVNQIDNQIDNSDNIRVSVPYLETLGDLSEEMLLRKGSLEIYLSEIRKLSGDAQRNLELLDPNSASRNKIAIASLQNTFTKLALSIDLAEKQTDAMTQDVSHLRTNLRQALKCPISNLVRRFPRILHDLSAQHGKQAELLVQGAEVGIDRELSGTIAQPLEILIRNAFEYGLESPSERQQQGKSPQGKISIIAMQTNEATVIKVSDDGRGIDIAKIRNQVDRAASIAGISGVSIANMSDEQLLGLLFEPSLAQSIGISHLENTNELCSIRKRLSEVGGTISVQSQRTIGTEFTIVLPNPPSLMRVLLIDINQICLAVPSNIILEVIPIDPFDALPDADEDTILWQDRLIPVVRLNPLLKLNCRQNLNQSTAGTGQSRQLSNQLERHKPDNAEPSFLVVRHDNVLFAIQTDGCWSEQDATFHQVEGDILLPQIFLGTVILGTNQPVALVNPSEVVSKCLRQSINTELNHYAVDPNLQDIDSLSDFFGAGDMAQISNPPGILDQLELFFGQTSEPENLESSKILINDFDNTRPIIAFKPKVLIVESSANIRRYLAMTLAKSGFLSAQVQNGQEAISLLKNTLNNKLDIDIVITDLETPQMNGFKLLSEIRGDQALQNLPVIVLTSRNNEDDKKLALDLGANAYFSKPYREQELVSTLQKIVST